MTKDIDSPPTQRINALVDSPAITPMPPEFQLMHPRRVRCSGWFEQPTGGMAHFIGFERLTPSNEANYRLTNPENGLHPDDLKAFRASTRGPVERGPVARFFARFKFWMAQ